MRAIVVMFDSLNRHMLPPYGAEGVHAPNFERLARSTAMFTNCYAGSMPCMPARREMHTGRHNFLHRSWSPLEPFDDSVPEMLKGQGVYTHLVTDHQHYWEDGGATYHNRFNTYEFFRGQEGDAWKGHVAPATAPATLNADTHLTRQDWINRQYLKEEADHPQTRTFDAGLEFMQTNVSQDRWMLQIECFDPHEPFFSYDQYRKQYGLEDAEGPVFDWPSYRRVIEEDDVVDRARNEYLSLLSMCDRSLGRVMDFMDEHDMWQDTLLMVCTDHGFLLGEHGWWGKSIQPWYDETIHTPLFIWDPRTNVSGQTRESLVQTIDFGPTLLEFFGVDRTADMQGKPLVSVIESDEPLRESALFGSFGAHVNVTDGRYVYMRSCATPENKPLFDFTLMPTHMRSRFKVEELRDAALVDGFSFTKGIPLLRVPGWSMGSPYGFGTLLFDLEADPHQENPLKDTELEHHMATLLVELMRANDAPVEQFMRLGLPGTGPVRDEHLLIEQNWPQVVASREPAARVQDFPADAIVATVPLAALLKNQHQRETLVAAMPALGNGASLAIFASRTVVEAAAMTPNLRVAEILKLETALSQAGS
ncbi:sulfatase [Arthrobacter sp. MI7-26]|uniref:sulfatase n=1 Tax=Arthrobacter sp. MI7-26 TaxID=2993653 RepID=UPI002248C04F|nr:sulfatase [Arthrobacter sp. MI7-26]MCX2746829.1 sulfatase [Arthrobacter sp. MI7-26]